MTLFYGIPVPDPVEFGYWDGTNQAELESWLGVDITVNDDQSITFTPTGQGHSGPFGPPPITVTCPLNNYIYPGGDTIYTVSSTSPTASGGPLQEFIPGQTFALDGP